VQATKLVPNSQIGRCLRTMTGLAAGEDMATVSRAMASNDMECLLVSCQFNQYICLTH